MAFKRKKEREVGEINSDAMADIAFVLLIFFIITTAIAFEKGLITKMQKKRDPNAVQQEHKIENRNMFVVLVNSNNQLLVENQVMKLDQLQD